MILNDFIREVRIEFQMVILDALGKYECPSGKSLEDVPKIVNITTLQVRLIAH